MKNKTKLFTVCGAIGITTVAWGGAISTNFAKADVIDTITVTVELSCSMTSTLDSAHVAEISGGTTKSDIGQTSLKAICNDAGGYAIYAIGNSGDTSGSTDLIAASPLTTASNIVTGTETSGNTSNWAMKLTAGNDGAVVEGGYGSYSAVPSVSTKVASKASGTSIVDSVAVTSTYRAFISTSQPAGSYAGQVKYTLVDPSTATP